MQNSFISDRNKYILCVPFAYAVASRMAAPRDFIFNAVTSWAPGIILVMSLARMPMPSATILYFIGYVIFVCMYEIGYLTNDSYALRNDPTPRRRVYATFDLPFVTTFVTTRVIVFLLLAAVSNLAKSPLFWAGHAALAVTLLLHNTLPQALKFASFIQLSTLRFSLPVICALIIDAAVGQLNVVLLIAMFLFVYFRFLTYMDAKHRLDIPERKGLYFLLMSLGVMAPMIAVIAFFADSYAPWFVWGWLGGVQLIYVCISNISIFSPMRTALRLHGSEENRTRT